MKATVYVYLRKEAGGYVGQHQIEATSPGRLRKLAVQECDRPRREGYRLRRNGRTTWHPPMAIDRVEVEEL